MKNYTLIAFVVLALIQLFVPMKMILDKENVLRTGQVFKFKTAPVDPNDPFRGKYINLHFEASQFPVINSDAWAMDQDVFVQLTTDADGFAKVLDITPEIPSSSAPYLKARINSISPDVLFLEYPFDRYYMEETKAYEAEQLYRETLQDTLQTTYALVRIKAGDAVLEDVMVDGVPIREVVKRENVKN
jgi:uncharacterized membrane-anchored protein